MLPRYLFNLFTSQSWQQSVNLLPIMLFKICDNFFVFNFQGSLKDICFENVECILKLLEDNPQNLNAIILKKTKRSFKGKKGTVLKNWSIPGLFFIYFRSF